MTRPGTAHAGGIVGACGGAALLAELGMIGDVVGIPVAVGMVSSREGASSQAATPTLGLALHWR